MVHAAVPPVALDVIARIAGAAARLTSITPETPIDELERDLTDVDFVVFDHADQQLRQVLPRLRPAVVQVLTASPDWATPFLPKASTVCTALGSRDLPVAEWILSALLGYYSGLLEAVRRQPLEEWQRFRHEELAGKTVVIVGEGSIGRTLRPLLEALEVSVLGITRSGREGTHPPEKLPELAALADALVVLAPLTEETRGLVDASVLAKLRPGGLLVNAGRGPVVDREALLVALGERRIRAVVDVSDPEPLPSGHPIWRAPGLFVSPHLAGETGAAAMRAWTFAGDQLVRYATGKPLRGIATSSPLGAV